LFDSGRVHQLTRKVAPVPFLEQHIGALKKAGAGRKLKKAKARIKFKDASAKELWTELGDYSRKCSGERVHAGYVEALIDMLVPFEYPAEKELLELLEDEEIAEQWLEVFLVELAAARKLDSAVPIIHRKIHIDDDALAPACLEALGTIGTEEVVTANRA
jgi:HEAT repeat protein